MQKLNTWASYTALALILMTALYLRLPYVSQSLPYFYDEDEAHHFNRLVEMAKSRDLNPHYFNKPSLHFYLRLPVLYLATQVEEWRGSMRSIKEVRTRDRFGIAGYAFSTSHPALVQWVRGLSVLFSLAIVLLTYLIGREAFENSATSLMAALISAIAPPLVSASSVIGVDTPMAMMCLLSVYFCMRMLRSSSPGHLLAATVFAGLAVSTKYNAAPIAALPLACCLLAKRSDWRSLLIAILVPPLAFLAGTPYLLISLPLFIQNVQYEVWHYAVAGHEGHTAERGLPQFLFYLRWFGEEAIGWLGVIGAFLGAWLFAWRKRVAALPLLLFPFMFALLMVLQRANFTRNMLVVIPFGALAACAGLQMLLSHTLVLRIGFFIALLTQPLILLMSQRFELFSARESREDLRHWVESYPSPRPDIAVSGDLQAAFSLLSLPGVSAVEPTLISNPEELWNLGYDLIVTPQLQSSTNSLILETSFSGREIRRVVRDPALSVYRFDLDGIRAGVRAALSAAPKLHLLIDETGNIPSCPRTEGHCWIRKRVSFLSLPAKMLSLDSHGHLTIQLRLMTPWPDQTLTLRAADWSASRNLGSDKPGEWQTVSLQVPLSELQRQSGVFFEISQVHSPREAGISTDGRRLGVALDEIRFDNRT